MPPNVHSPRSASRLVLHSTGRAIRLPHQRCRWFKVLPLLQNNGSYFTPTTQRQYRAHHDFTAGDSIRRLRNSCVGKVHLRSSPAKPAQTRVASTKANSSSLSQKAAGQGAFEIRGNTTVCDLRAAAIRPASPALCSTTGHRPQSQRRIHSVALSRPSPRAASGLQ